MYSFEVLSVNFNSLRPSLFTTLKSVMDDHVRLNMTFLKNSLFFSVFIASTLFASTLFDTKSFTSKVLCRVKLKFGGIPVLDVRLKM